MGFDFGTAGDLGSAAAAVIATIAAVVAFRQAKIAELARVATEDQARSARLAVKEAEASRHHAQRPQFTVEATAPPNATIPWTTITMVDGPEVDATITWHRTLSHIEFDDEAPTEVRSKDSGSYEASFAINGQSMIPWWKDSRPNDLIFLNARITIETVETTGDRRRWRHTADVHWTPE
ncbi:hypothetical protein HX744_00975 [Pseudonocardia sp. ICBG1122]|nr:hypothetical protein [Pseudonocardia pini]